MKGKVRIGDESLELGSSFFYDLGLESFVLKGFE
jgi:hypothetical protein